MRRRARSVIAPRIGEAMKIDPIEIAVMTPYTVVGAQRADLVSNPGGKVHATRRPSRRWCWPGRTGPSSQRRRVGISRVWLAGTTEVPCSGSTGFCGTSIAALHHVTHAAQRRDVARRIAIDRDQIGEQARLDPTDRVSMCSTRAATDVALFSAASAGMPYSPSARSRARCRRGRTRRRRCR